MNLTSSFRRKIPHGKEYADRLARELKLIEKNNFANVFLQVREILDLVPDFRHVTRGSAGCSLVGYLLGIHNLDPVQNCFALSRFMHELRTDLPDIDLDFSYNQRDIVLEKVKEKYPGRVARISNHVKYRENSAIRQALREMGQRKFVPKHFELDELAGENSNVVLQRATELCGSFKNYSLHCGGIVIFPDKIPNDLKLDENQIKLNKDEIEERGYFKIDLLCNRAIAQLNDLSDRPLEDYPENDDLTSKVFQSADTWGLTFGESPAQRRLNNDLKPKSRSEITLSLAMIRPLPSADGRRVKILEQFHQKRSHDGHLIYDDDGIYFIQKLLNCSEAEAELYRKAFGKKKQEKISEFLEKIKYHSNRKEIAKELSYFGLYSFCHAHAMSYGQLVWALAYEKARQPQKFWLSALNHAQTMYRPWVHVQESKKAGLKFMGFGKGPWKLIGEKLYPKHEESIGDGWSQFYRRGYWISDRFMPGMFEKWKNNFVEFRGLIATGRHHRVNQRDITFVTIGTNTGKYLDLIFEGSKNYDKYDIVEGSGLFQNNSVQVSNFQFEKAQKCQQLNLFSN